eukprot:TRINITY_DN2710_c0_g1_i1.p1 TRINITY_DN2710_c0_g1~~TRINITY_DN2710_c0_g1_i1.p1  ORF type:complete len:189 (+),score=45.13 TRINITY_DN2710_c0_g1_i1:74-640(+)
MTSSEQKTSTAITTVTQESNAKQKKEEDADIAYVKELLTEYKDFPKKGVVFRDIFPVFADSKALEMVITRFVYHIQSTYTKVDMIVGLEARGFLFGPSIALRLHAGFAPIRKAGKLPGKVTSVKYEKEYGYDEFVIGETYLKAKQKVIIIDDLLATGGTFIAALDLVKKVGALPLECACMGETKSDNY